MNDTPQRATRERSRQPGLRRRVVVALGAPLALTLVMLAAPGEASAGEVYIGGTSLRLRASQQSTERRSFAFRSAADPSIGPPFPDPTAGASLLVFASNAAGECRAEIPLDPAGWTENRGDGPNYGYRYDGDPATDQGIKRIRLIRRKNGGRVAVRARGGGWPCGLEATAQSTPVAVALRVDDVRYCAEFGAGTVTRNQTGGLRARNAPAPAACPDDDLTVANLNLLHGLGCPDSCRGADRVALLYQWIAGSGCPDVVTLQEILPALLPFIQAQNLTVCPFPYEILYEQTNPFDNELVLSRYPILASEVRPLWLGFRRVTWARLDHPIGPVDVFTTHLASGSDGGPSPCGASCPAECVTAGAVTNRDCQAVQMALLVEEKHDVDAPGAITGDFNDEPGTFVYDQFRDRGWPDTYLAVGNPECAPLTGVGCTSGRATSLAEIESTAANVDERIDYTFLIPPGPASTCVAALDAASDDDGDGSATRIFADDPNPFSPSCGAAPDPVCWPSDHEGSEMDLNCG